MCTDVDECAINPCRNGGTCVNDYGKYFCLCCSGFAGYDCERSEQMRVTLL